MKRVVTRRQDLQVLWEDADTIFGLLKSAGDSVVSRSQKLEAELIEDNVEQLHELRRILDEQLDAALADTVEHLSSAPILLERNGAA